MIFDKNERFHNSCKISFYWLPSSRGGPHLILIGAIPKSVQLVLAMMLIKICRTSLTTEVNCFASTSVGRNTLYSGGKYFVLRWEILCVQVRNTLCSCEKYSVLKLCNCECDNIFFIAWRSLLRFSARTSLNRHKDSNAVFCQSLFWKWKVKIVASHFIISETQTNYKYVTLRPCPIQ